MCVSFTHVLVGVTTADLGAAGILDGDTGADDGGGDVVALAKEAGQVESAEDTGGDLVARLGVAAVDAVGVAAVVTNLSRRRAVGGDGRGDGEEGDEDGSGEHFEGVWKGWLVGLEKVG